MERFSRAELCRHAREFLSHAAAEAPTARATPAALATGSPGRKRLVSLPRKGHPGIRKQQTKTINVSEKLLSRLQWTRHENPLPLHDNKKAGPQGEIPPQAGPKVRRETLALHLP